MMAVPLPATVPIVLLPESRAKTIAELAADQHVRIPQDVRCMIGAGADLWDGDEEFESFLNWLQVKSQS
jgi:hypothetical protein